jgi:polyhydroxyalkanoate synthesis repressor PhaR
MAATENPAPDNEGGAEPAIIVRYPNRRLYDRSQGRYVTLQEIATMVREGKSVCVRDSKTDADLTSTILTQIILEHHPERMELLPVPVLHQMLRANGTVLGLLRDYFHQSLSYLNLWQRAATFNPMAASMDWLKSFLPSAPPAGTAQSEAEALARRLEEMERRLNELAAARPKEGGQRRPPRRKGK